MFWNTENNDVKLSDILHFKLHVETITTTFNPVHQHRELAFYDFTWTRISSKYNKHSKTWHVFITITINTDFIMKASRGFLVCCFSRPTTSTAVVFSFLILCHLLKRVFHLHLLLWQLLSCCSGTCFNLKDSVSLVCAWWHASSDASTNAWASFQGSLLEAILK